MFDPTAFWTVFGIGVGSVFLILVLTLGTFFLGFEAGRRSALGMPQGIFGPEKGGVMQAPDISGVGLGGQGNPLQSLDDVIGRALGDLRRPQPKNLIDPELSGLAPTQARAGGDL